MVFDVSYTDLIGILEIILFTKSVNSLFRINKTTLL